MFNDDHRYWQDHFDSRRIADRIDELLVSDAIDAHAKAFIDALKLDLYHVVGNSVGGYLAARLSL